MCNKIHATYLFFGHLQRLQAVADNLQFFLKLHNFSKNIEDLTVNRNIQKLGKLHLVPAHVKYKSNANFLQKKRLKLTVLQPLGNI